MVAKKVDLHNYFEEIQRKSENEAMSFLQTVSKDTEPKNLKIMFLHKHACDLLHEELQAQSVAEYL